MQKVPFYAEDYRCQKQGGICRRYLKLQGLCLSSVKYVCSRINTSFHTKDHETHQVIYVYTLLHQATRGDVKNSLRKPRYFFVSDRDLQVFFFIILH